MGASVSSTVGMGLVYCCCNAASSVCQSCLGSTDIGTTTGRKRSVLLLTIAVAFAFWFQYWVGPAIVTQNSNSWIWKSYRILPGMGKMVYHAWYDDCEYIKSNKQQENEEEVMHALEQCAGMAGVFRPMSMAFLFFVSTAIATKVQPSLNRQVWPAKYTLYVFLVAMTVFFHSAPLFTGVFLWLARLGATVFVVLQQVILIDVAYNWNEDWVDRADQADRLIYGSGSSWLHAIVGTCVGFYVAALVGIVMLYHYFDGCAENTWIITLTLLGILTLTGIQLSGSEGSLLTSSVMSLYVTYLAYSMVSKNPNGQCNPQLGDNDVWGIVIGLTLTAISLAWTGWSWTAEDRLNIETVQSARPLTGSDPAASTAINLEAPFLDPNGQPTTGLVMDRDNAYNTAGMAQFDPMATSQVWKLNVVMALICCWVAMILTGWGAMDGDAANPTVGRFNMAMMGLSQWTAIGLYIWTLLAPRLFPDRDFS